jgi:glutathione S-transferase
MHTDHLDRAQLPELFQTEWCPASRRVRQRLTELDVSYVCRQVPVDRDDRELLVQVTGDDSVPALLSADGHVHVGEDEIYAYLDERYEEPAGAEAHRLKARKARQRELEEATR